MAQVNAESDVGVVETTPQTTTTKQAEEPRHLWMVRSCEDYSEEYSDCKSFKARFHQYFIKGELADCGQWKEDFEACQKWDKNQDIGAVSQVIESEKLRIRERLQAHYNNDIWEGRKEPPSAEQWNHPLPQDIQKGYENSFLKEKADALREGREVLGNVDENIRSAPLIDTESASTTSMCVIV